MSTPSTRKPIVIGNWKMNGTRESLGEIEALNAGLIKA
ncbi:MAG: triose-phosphate isomerase, partial [Pseudomonadota bacterium]